MCVRVCAGVCACDCVRACVCACVHVRVLVYVCMCVSVHVLRNLLFLYFVLCVRLFNCTNLRILTHEHFVSARLCNPAGR